MAIRCLLRGREFSSRRWFLGLDNGDVLQAESLEALLLIQTAALGQGRGGALCQALLRGFAFSSVAQKTPGTGRMNHAEVLQRVTRLLPTVIVLWLCGLGRAVDWTFSALRPPRGGVDLPSVAGVLNSAANAAAVRAGSRSGSAQA